MSNCDKYDQNYEKYDQNCDKYVKYVENKIKYATKMSTIVRVRRANVCEMVTFFIVSHLTHEDCIDFPDEPSPHRLVSKTPLSRLDMTKYLKKLDDSF